VRRICISLRHPQDPAYNLQSVIHTLKATYWPNPAAVFGRLRAIAYTEVYLRPLPVRAVGVDFVAAGSVSSNWAAVAFDVVHVAAHFGAPFFAV